MYLHLEPNHVSRYALFLKMNAQCRVSPSKARWIVTKMPVVVLMNPDRAGSLLAKPPVNGVVSDDPFWSERAFVYVMGKEIAERI